MSELTDLEQRERAEYRDKYSSKQREEAGKSGEALEDGSYPIKDKDDLEKAIRAVGRGTAHAHNTIRQHIMKRAKALGLTELIPDNWGSDGSRSNDAVPGDVHDNDPCPTCKGSTEVDGAPCPTCQSRSHDAEWEARDRAIQENRGKTETRYFPCSGLEIRETADGGRRFTGYASTTEQRYDIGDPAINGFTETIAKGAFKRTLGEDPDVRFTINHGAGGGLPIARTKSGTLTLVEDARGLRVDADLNMADPDVRALIPKIERGDVDEMSFAFRCTDDVWNEARTDRVVRSVSLHNGDVSIVTVGANPDTAGVAIRSSDGEWELRGRQPITDPTMVEKLSQTLDLIAKADENLDTAQPILAHALGRANPDAKDPPPQRAAPLDHTTRAAQEIEIMELRRAA